MAGPWHRVPALPLPHAPAATPVPVVSGSLTQRNAVRRLLAVQPSVLCPPQCRRIFATTRSIFDGLVDKGDVLATATPSETVKNRASVWTSNMHRPGGTTGAARTAALTRVTQLSASDLNAWNRARHSQVGNLAIHSLTLDEASLELTESLPLAGVTWQALSDLARRGMCALVGVNATAQNIARLAGPAGAYGALCSSKSGKPHLADEGGLIGRADVLSQYPTW